MARVEALEKDELFDLNKKIVQNLRSEWAVF